MTATTIPCSTPSSITPAVATRDTAKRAPAHLQVAAQDAEVHQRQRGDDHDRGERRLREVGQQRVEEQQEHRDQAGADEAGDLALGSRLFGHRGPRAARRHGEALEEPGGDVRRAHADHLLVGLDLFAAPGREARRGGDRVGQGHERDAHRGDQQGNDVAGGGPGERGRGNTLRQRADRGDAACRRARTPPMPRWRRRTATSTAGSRVVMRGSTSSRTSTATPTSERRRVASGRGPRRTRGAPRGTSRRAWRSRTASAAGRR